MSGVVVFDFQAWAAAYPAAAADLTQPQGQMYFDESTLFLNNTDRSQVRDLNRRRIILWMITAHIALLNKPKGPHDGIVGRISSANQGSVSVSTEMPAPQSAAWWNQTQPGATAYQSLLRIGLTRYFPVPPYNFTPYPWNTAVWRR